jgi:hypothetical protein
LKGYLSTSFSASHIIQVGCESESNSLSIMCINVPKGKKCIYIPGREHELLFPHNTEIEMLSKTENQTFSCISSLYSELPDDKKERCSRYKKDNPQKITATFYDVNMI